MKLLKFLAQACFWDFYALDTSWLLKNPNTKSSKLMVTFEIRKYAPILIAETFVDGDMDEASNKGFRLIADYIFGNNQVVDSNANTKIAMTAPVTVEPVSQKIAMTAPVTVEPQSTDTNIQLAKNGVFIL